MLETLCALWDAAAELPRSVAFATSETSITYTELAGRVGAMARRLRSAGPTVGLYVSGIDGVIADLAVAAAGRTAVPIPDFFSPRQIDHIIADAGIDCVITASEAMLGRAGPSISVLSPDTSVAPMTLPEALPARIVYTSGTTGRPKGVRLGAAQIDLTCATLQAACDARADDRHISVLPVSTLLETICGLCLPIRVGAVSMLMNDILDPSRTSDSGARIGGCIALHRPTTTVLTPQLLTAWVSAIECGRAAFPRGLRFVAVGGAPAGASLLLRAWKAGIPAYEGYGLTECCSVVSMNRPGIRRFGTVGKALPHVDVAIEDGEIVIRSEALMDGYLGDASTGGVYRTGDVGAFDDDGFLTVHGRKDNIIVLPNGRKISPEWVEAEIAGDWRIAGCVIYVDSTQTLATRIALSVAGQEWADRAETSEIHAFFADRCSTLPSYARPRKIALVDIAQMNEQSARGDPAEPNAGVPGPEGDRTAEIAAHGVF